MDVEKEIRRLLVKGDREGAEELYRKHAVVKEDRGKILGPCPKKRKI